MKSPLSPTGKNRLGPREYQGRLVTLSKHGFRAKRPKKSLATYFQCGRQGSQYHIFPGLAKKAKVVAFASNKNIVFLFPSTDNNINSHFS